jgi:hypothetical protein
VIAMSNRPSLRARWLPAVKRTRLVGPSCRRMLTEIGEHHMTEAGRAAVTQERLAATLGLSVVRVKHLFREARTARFLDLVQTGYRAGPVQSQLCAACPAVMAASGRGRAS